MTEKNFFIEGLGDIKFRKNRRSKNVSITIRPIHGVIVNLPFYVSYNTAKKIVKQKEAWIKKHIPKIQNIENKITLFDENTIFNTKYRKLIIKKTGKDNVRTEIKAESIIVEYPFNIEVNNQRLQEIIKQTIINALRSEARYYLPKRVEFWAHKCNFTYNRVFIKNNKTLWGSCSSVNNINLNLHLMRLPDKLIDYVIVHELCHTLEKNHGAGFWHLMNSIFEDSKKLSKELKAYSINIY